MAWFSTYKNGCYPDHGPRPLITDNRSVFGYSESHVMKSERVVEFRRVPVMTPRIMEVYMDRVEDHNPFRAFWNSPSDWLDKGYDFTLEGRGVIDRDTSPPSRDHDKGKYNNLNSNSDNYEDDDVVCKDGVCFKPNKGGVNKSFYPKEEENDNEKNKGKGCSPSSYTIPSPSVYDSYKGNGNCAPSSFVPPSTQPKKETYFKSSYPNGDEKNKGNVHCAPSSPVSRPRKDTYYESLYPENNEKHKENGYYAPSSPISRPRKDAYYESVYPENNEKHKGNGYYTPSSPVSQPKNDTYYESSYPENNEKHKGNAYSAPSSHVPYPRKDAYYESSYPENNEKHKGNDHYAPQPHYEPSNTRPILTSPQPIKTRSDHKVRGYENTKNSPGSTVGPHRNYDVSSARNNYEGYEEIDSAETRRRYARASPRAEEKYTGTIDCKEAARKYNGVFVPF